MFDCEEELIKINEHFPEALCVLRITTPDSEDKYNLNGKFGAPLEMTERLLKLGKKLGIRIKGVSFHVGTG